LLNQYTSDYEIFAQQDLITAFVNEIINEVEMYKSIKTDITHM
jgi:hypothetical protein